jgi:hypothetical protein
MTRYTLPDGTKVTVETGEGEIVQELALMYLRKALEEALRAGGTTLLDDLFAKLSAKQIDALVGILQAVKERKTQQTVSVG